MSWIGLTDLTSAGFNIRGLGVAEDAPGARPPAGPNEILPRGTLLFETRYDPASAETRPLLSYRRDKGWPREIAFALSAAGRLTALVRQGPTRSRAGLDLPPGLTPDSRLRVAYAWDAPRRQGRLSVELIDDGRLIVVPVRDPVPLPVADVKALMRHTRAADVALGTRYIAVADGIEPVGLGGGIGAGTPVETTEGPVLVERLRLGDQVITATAGPRPVRWIGQRTVPGLGGNRPIRVRAPYFGLGHDVILAPDQQIRLGVAEAEYMLGEDEVMIAAGHLAGGRAARREAGNRLVTYYQVLLDVHDCLLHDGLWSESLFVGTLARHPDLVRATVLGEMPVSAMPRHSAFARHKLSQYEARSLAQAIGA